MDKILLSGLCFQGCHGVLPQEKETAQPFIFDLELYLDLQQAGVSDDLSQTVSYAEIYDSVRQVFYSRSYNLLEALAEATAQTLLNCYPLEEVKISLYKPQAPVEGVFRHFGVEITRVKSKKNSCTSF